MAAEPHIVFIFNSIHRVLKTEKVFKSSTFPFRMQPTPRPLVSDCGLSIMVGEAHLGEALEQLSTHRIQLVQAWRLGPEGYEQLDLAAS